MTEALYVKQCLLLIEERLNWGPAKNWANYDFEKLSSLIEDKTAVVLSVTTLKRIWGKVRYDHSPTLTTLNTLARFLDYEDWRSFEKSVNILPASIPEIREEEYEATTDKKIANGKRSLKIAVRVSFVSVLLLFVVSLLIFSSRKDPVKKIDNAKYKFSANKVISEGVPNSVVFTYDASASPTDSVYIVQTWDIRRKTRVSKNNNKHSAIYYYPGYFRTKLIVDNTIVSTHDLQISSDGWLCLAENDPVPLYFKKEDYQKKDRIEIDKSILEKYNISLNPNPPKIRFFNQRDLGDLMNDNFIFETTLKNEFNDGINSCQYVEVLIQCKDDIIIIPLAAKACVGDMHLYAAGIELKSKESDLSGFGADLNQWTTLKVETKDKKMDFFVNNVLATSLVFPDAPTGIVGLQYRFSGVGAVRNTWFENKNGRIVMD